MTSPREKRKRSGVEPPRLLAAVPLGKATAARRQHRGSSGTGKGKNYKPWIRVHDISSLGKSTRRRGRKTDRTHTFFSDLEYHFFLLLEWDDSVVDIQEQYPLFPQAEIEQIADALGVKVPHIVGEKAPMTMTTDFLVTTKIGKEAWSIKPARALEKRRTLEKLEIERIYWDRRGVSFGMQPRWGRILGLQEKW